MFTYGVFFLSNGCDTCELYSAHFNISDARKALNYQLSRLSNNENQATANVKDGFHFYVKQEGSNYANEKRAMFIGRIYKNVSFSGVKAKETAQALFNVAPYFKYESLEYAL